MTKNIDRLNKLDEIAKEISFLDFSEIEEDCTDEAIWDTAYNLYDLCSKDCDKVLNIVMEKYISNIE